MDIINATREGNVERVRELLNNGVDVNKRDVNGHTVLMFACAFGMTKIAKLLLENGANIDEKSKNGKTALMITAIHKRVETAKMLLENGAKINERDDFGESALRIAATDGHMEMFTLLYTDADIFINSEDEISEDEEDEIWSLFMDGHLLHISMQ